MCSSSLMSYRSPPRSMSSYRVARASTRFLSAIMRGRNVRQRNWERSLPSREGQPAGTQPVSAELACCVAGLKLMLPSPNGSRLSLEVSGKTVLAGCLRNARAVAEAAMTCADGGDVAVIAAGERWPDGRLRPAIEDWLGAGSILRHIDLAFSAEAEAARLAYSSAGPDVARLIRSSVRVRNSCNPALDRTWKLLWRRAQAMAFRSCAMERSDNFRL